MLPNIGHFEKILVEPRLPNRIPEERFQRQRGTSGNNHPIELFFDDLVGNLLSGVRGTRKKLLLGIDNIRQSLNILHHGRNIHYTANIGPAVTHENSNPRFFPRDIPFHGIDLLRRQFSLTFSQQFTRKGAGPTGRKNRFRDIKGSLKGPTHKDTGTSGLYGIFRICFAESMGLQLDSKLLHKLIRVSRGIQPH